MSLTHIKVGVIALTDSAPFVVAHHLGLFSQAGVDVELLRQPSWATLRDKLIYGELDAAHMLSPMAIAVQLGLGGSPKKDMLAPLVLNRGGNAITVATPLAEKLAGLATGETLGSYLRAARSKGEPLLVFGTVFPFSMHTLQLRRWLRLNDVDPDSDVRFEVVPPVRMVAALKAGQIDGFCVGEPYNSVALNDGLGRIVATSNSLWPNAPEKVLGCSLSWAQANPVALTALTGSLGQACAWLEGGMDNRKLAAEWLSESAHDNLPRHLLELALLESVKTLVTTPLSSSSETPFIRFDGVPVQPSQQPVFDSLVAETLALTVPVNVEPADLKRGVMPFGF